MKRYNGLNSVKIDLAACGICNACGRRFTDPLCKHGTTEQVEFTRQLDAKVDAEYEQKRQAREIAKDNDWLGELHNSRDIARVIPNRLESVRMAKPTKTAREIALDENGNLRPYSSFTSRRGAIADDHEIHSYTVDGE